MNDKNNENNNDKTIPITMTMDNISNNNDKNYTTITMDNNNNYDNNTGQ